MKRMYSILAVLVALTMIVSMTASAQDKVVKILGPFGTEEEARFNDAIKGFEEETGIDVLYESTREFETLINVRVEAGDAPDLAAVPQPGLMQRFAANGKLVALWPEITPCWMPITRRSGKTWDRMTARRMACSIA